MYEVILMDDNVVIRMYTTNMGGLNLTFDLNMLSMQMFIQHQSSAASLWQSFLYSIYLLIVSLFCVQLNIYWLVD